MNILDELTVDRGHLAQLHARLGVAAGDDLDVAYRTVDSPVGQLLLAASRLGLVRVAFAAEGFDAVLGNIAEKVSPRILAEPGRLDDAARSLDAYFTGDLHTFELPLDLSMSHGFRQVVQQYLPRIPYGHTESYGQVAQHVGNPRAVRAVGTACATNPLPIVVPCHRVLRSDGSIGAYLGGVDAKRALLDLEHRNR